MATPGTAGSATIGASDTELLDFSNVPYKGASTVEVRVDSGDCDFRVPGLHGPGDYATIKQGECAYFRWGNRLIASLLAKSAGGADIRYWVAVATGSES